MLNLKEAILAVRHNGQQRQIRCPAHDDRRASLSVARGEDGKVLLHCHAGCAAAEIVAAGGVQTRDLFVEREKTSEPEATFDYHDEHGTLLFQAVRFPGKQFRQRRPDGAGGWIWKLDDTRRVLYRLPELKDHPATFVVEGERDVETLRVLGLTATTNCGGAGKWRPEYAEQLKGSGCKRVCILPDNDPPGESHARQVARSCHDAGLTVRVLPLPGLPAKGDVSDWLRTHSKDELLEAVRGCPVFDPSRVVAAGFKFELTSLADLLAEPENATDWIVQDRIPVGSIVLLAGRPKAGKSTLARDLSYAVATGERWLGWRTAFGPVWYLAFEDKRSELRRHFRAMGATGAEPIRLFAGQAPSEILPALLDLATRERPILIIVDTLQRLIRAKDFSDYAAITIAFEPLLRLSRETGATLLLLTHASTHTDRTGLDAVLGSTALSGSADNVFVLARTERYRTLSSVQRIGPDLEPTVLSLNEHTGRIEVVGRKRDADEADAADRILELLAGQTEPVTESWLLQQVEGRGFDKTRALRSLLRSGRVLRTGGGHRGDPYRYLVCSDANAKNVKNTQSRNLADFASAGTEKRNATSSIDTDSCLDFNNSPILSPALVRTYVGLRNVVTSHSQSLSPELSKNHHNDYHETQVESDKTGLDSQSRDFADIDDFPIEPLGEDEDV